jgi:hypothetical protein
MQALQFSVSIPQWIVLKALGFASRKRAAFVPVI